MAGRLGPGLLRAALRADVLWGGMGRERLEGGSSRGHQAGHGRVYSGYGRIANWKMDMAIEIVDFPMKNADFPQLC